MLLAGFFFFRCQPLALRLGKVPVKLQDRYDAARLFVMHCSVPSMHVPMREEWADLSGYTVHSNFKWVP